MWKRSIWTTVSKQKHTAKKRAHCTGTWNLMVSEWLLQQEHIIREEELAWGSQLWSIFFKNMSLMLGLGGFFKKINVKGAPCASCNHYKLGNHLVHVVFWLAGSCCKGCLWIPWQRTHCRYLWPIRRSISAAKKLKAFRMIKIALWFTALDAFLMLRLRSIDKLVLSWCCQHGSRCQLILDICAPKETKALLHIIEVLEVLKILSKNLYQLTEDSYVSW